MGDVYVGTRAPSTGATSHGRSSQPETGVSSNSTHEGAGQPAAASQLRQNKDNHILEADTSLEERMLMQSAQMAWTYNMESCYALARSLGGEFLLDEDVVTIVVPYYPMSRA
jgi:hypothetical protein